MSTTRNNTFSKSGDLERKITRPQKAKFRDLLFYGVRLSYVFGILCAAIVWGFSQLGSTNAQISSLDTEIKSKLARIEELNSEISKKTQAIENASEEGYIRYVAAQKLGMYKATEENVVNVTATAKGQDNWVAKNPSN